MVRYHHMIAYTRFNISNKGILWTRLGKGFEPIIIKFFSNRYPLFYIMIEYQGKTYVKKKGLKLLCINKRVEVAVKDYEKHLQEVEFLKPLTSDGVDLWSTFYDSQYIKQRRNHKLFHHFIPKYLKNVKGLQKEFNSLTNCEKITKFIKE